MRTDPCLFLLCLVFLPAFCFADGRRELETRSWQPIKNIKDPHVIEIAKFAITEYNKKSGQGFEFDSVVKGEKQTVSGTNYRLVVAVVTFDEKATIQYQTVVWEKLSGEKKFVSFKPIN
ncbi:Cysteine proteinase inhibitor [Quillaja saponaria]|uniref:Cysteine proteinase inhibitor n=1 Tax=Quillaja saponaria TaxID=32244 RepID=A0AAD7KMN3_QUISA|nr:Cysteine proteinase inhibitor [Quillaja saponaria]